MGGTIRQREYTGGEIWEEKIREQDKEKKEGMRGQLPRAQPITE